MKLIIALAAGLGLASAASAASFDEIVVLDGPTALVLTAGLDLKSDAGRLALKERIESAAAKLCGDNMAQPPEEQVLRRSCYRQAVTDGFEQMRLLTETVEPNAATR